MKRLTVVISALAALAIAQEGPNKVLQKDRVGGEGRFDYVYADSAGRRLYVPRVQTSPRISVYDLDTLKLVGEIPNVSAHGVAVDPKAGHGFASSKPVAMFNTKTLAPLKTIDVEGNPDGILFDPYNERVWVFSHRAPNATIIDAKDGSIVGTMDLGGAPEQAVSDDKGHLWVDLEDKDSIAAVDTKTLKVTATYGLEGKGGGPGGLAFDARHRVLFASCHNPATMVMLNADTGKILDALPIGQGTDGATFDPATMEAFSSNGDGTLTVIKDDGGTKFSVEQNVETMRGAKTLTLDSKTNHILMIAAETQPAPPPPADAPAEKSGRGRGRGVMVPGSFTIVVVGTK
ncbi:MAG TPA: YncE family protein [Bryobacteraceae bacterium]|nr:YncE family protein [Bryobacteraceae bacterium]